MLKSAVVMPLAIGAVLYAAMFSTNAADADALRPNGEIISAHDDAVRKINLTGRQSMFIEHIAKSMCFAQNGVETAELRNQVMQAQWLFQTTSSQLRDGDKNQKLLPEKHPEVLVIFDKVDALWAQFNDHINSWTAANGQDKNSVLQIDPLSVQIVDEIHNAEYMLEKVYHEEGAVTLETEKAIEAFDFLRMMTQKMSKEYCFSIFDLNAAANSAQLKQTMAQFLELLDSAQTPHAAASGWVMPEEALSALAKVRSEYDTLSLVLTPAAAGDTSTSLEYMELTIKQGLLMMTQLGSAIYHLEKLR
ncbi:MAG: type IV pili methyl-accepting chemotaxis transducer N-terminal domain-containing protein [Rhodobacteraceae bacterium]|nr:type IV pili methyl-accepting chemotaxis transducer N-terminal domain-containing protein [Paracoccaceae bacterium]